MPISAVWLKIDAERVVDSLQPAFEMLVAGEKEVVLDFSAVRRIDTAALHELEKLAGQTKEKDAKAILCGVHVDVYKVLKLMKLTAQFSFLN